MSLDTIFKPIVSEKEMSNGNRDMSMTPLTNKEIMEIEKEIIAIGADLDKFVFNDPEHIQSSTCYNFEKDLVYVTRNIFPDLSYGSTHPRDQMSVRAVLAHEYYGHRTYREEYLSDFEKGVNYHTTIPWSDECRASITASKLCPNLSNQERSHLIYDAVYRAKEAGSLLELDDYMKEVLYGYRSTEKSITGELTPLRFVRDPDYNPDARKSNYRKRGEATDERGWSSNYNMSEVYDASGCLGGPGEDDYTM